MAKDYIKERNLKKIPSLDKYAKTYEIKTKRKNKWIISFDFVKNGVIHTVFSAYYYTSKGLRVVQPAKGQYMIFNSHVFKRWNERLNKNIVQPIDMIKYFLSINDNVVVKYYPKDESVVFGIVPDGFILGNKYSKDIIIVKTFINRDLARKDQCETENEILEALKYESVMSMREK